MTLSFLSLARLRTLTGTLTGGRRRGRRGHRPLMSRDAGTTTAEYALVVLGAVAFAGVLITVLRSDAVRSAIEGIVQRALAGA